MPRIRTIKPEFWEDAKVGRWSESARLLFLGGLNFADDYGVLRSDPAFLRSRIFPYDDHSLAEVSAMLDECVGSGSMVEIERQSEIARRERVVGKRSSREAEILRSALDGLAGRMETLMHHEVTVDPGKVFSDACQTMQSVDQALRLDVLGAGR